MPDLDTGSLDKATQELQAVAERLRQQRSEQKPEQQTEKGPAAEQSTDQTASATQEPAETAPVEQATIPVASLHKQSSEEFALAGAVRKEAFNYALASMATGAGEAWELTEPEIEALHRAAKKFRQPCFIDFRALIIKHRYYRGLASQGLTPNPDDQELEQIVSQLSINLVFAVLSQGGWDQGRAQRLFDHKLAEVQKAIQRGDRRINLEY